MDFMVSKAILTFISIVYGKEFKKILTLDKPSSMQELNMKVEKRTKVSDQRRGRKAR
ncbi:unnamed protein product [Dovyalis caffra]|uniref:Uncharacterized protein n=1 Tax=Dovyalis caffra TaxID=77055 RepID=A0AAV1S1G0_9ROSI|nr:unnamed protein product [Dovyalis caffra]